jgi:hypothetical protein
MASPTTFTPFVITPNQLGTAIGTIYTAGANGAIIDHLQLVNATGTPGTTALYYLPGGGTASGTNNLFIGNVPSDGNPMNVFESLHGRPFHMTGTSMIIGSHSATGIVTYFGGGVDYA